MSVVQFQYTELGAQAELHRSAFCSEQSLSHGETLHEEGLGWWRK